MLRDALRCWYTGTHYVKGSQNTAKPCALGSFSALKAMHELKPRQLGPAVSSWRALPQLIRSFGNLRTLVCRRPLVHSPFSASMLVWECLGCSFSRSSPQVGIKSPKGVLLFGPPGTSFIPGKMCFFLLAFHTCIVAAYVALPISIPPQDGNYQLLV